MKKIFHSRIFQFSSALFFACAIFVIALSFFSPSANSATTSKDAIAIRVLPNTNHYSPLRWYKEQGFSGSPQSMLVDGYEAVRDGRTVYVGVANIVGTKFYTNIYLISYNQAAESATIDIFGKILAHWKFNTNVTTVGNCSLETEKACLSDDDCASDEHCDSAKAKIIRDTKRLADLADLNTAIETYFSQYDYYPKITSGTYLTNKSISTWPSWNTTLGAELGIAMPVDPINELGDCGGENIDKNGNQYTGTNATCSMDGSDYTGSCNGAYWDYSFSVSKDGNYQAFIESANNSSSPYGDLDVFTLKQESVCPASGVQHKVEIYMDDVLKGYVCNDAVDSNQSHQIGDVDLGFITAGTHTIKYKWVNDWTYNPDGVWGTGDEADSNVRIYKVGLAEISGYDAVTCWDAVNKKFAGTVNGNNLTLPAGSNVYTYSAVADGSSYSLDMSTESGSLNADGSYSYGGGGNASNAGTKTNQVPIFAGVNLPSGVRKMPYTGYIEASDGDGDYLTWSFATVGDWSSWPVQPILQDAGVKNQKMIYSSQAGELGDYVFSVTVSDGKGGSYTTTGTIKIKNYCKDDDGDGYGVSPKSGKTMGCAYDGNDCDDTPGVHIKNGAYGDVNIDGNKINPAQPDNCTQYDGLDNNCDGQTDENAQTQGLLSNIDFESGSIGGVPSGWSGSGQDRSSVGLTQSNAHSGIQSVLIHQDSNVQYPGVCSQAYCDSSEYYYSGDCAWDNSTKECKFTAPDTCHSGSNAVYAEGESFCWGHSNTRDWAYLSYNVSSLPFNPGDTYIIYFYYKGNVAFGGSLYPSFGYSLGWHGQCYGQNSFAYWPCSSNAYGGYSPTDPDLCLMHAKSAAGQTACYPAIYMPAVADNNYTNWTYYSTSFDYTSELAQVKDDSGNKAHNFGLSVGYNTTGAAGSDLYIDDFKLVKCVNK